MKLAHCRELSVPFDFIHVNLSCIVPEYSFVRAINVPFHKVKVSRSAFSFRNVDAVSNDTYGFQNLNNEVYVGQILVAGHNFTVQLDTGSSDLWIDPSDTNVVLQGTKDTGVTSTICYFDTTCASGSVLISDVTFGNLTIPGQAFINAVGSNATYGNMTGLLGLGSTSSYASAIIQSLDGDNDVNSETFLQNLFNVYPDTPNFISFLLSRSDFGVTDGGTFTIGELAAGMQAVQQTPQLPVLSENGWVTAAAAIIVNGREFVSQSSTPSPALVGDQLLTSLDTGTSRAQAPQPLVDAIYQNLPDAVYDDGSYTMPCDSKINVSIIFGEQTFPIHPIDIVVVPDPGENARTDANNTLCIGAFSYLESEDLDILLGDTFLRNAYVVYNFGNWTRADDGLPSMQIMSTTNETQAWAEFDSLNSARLAARQQQQKSQKTSAASRHPYPTLQTLFIVFCISCLIYLL
ncbi:hypothetical protein EW026_g3293 [Hermanssonia centrifuga]|uniref:Peptidase A1 domain-containing protein n=1 Tax=Hermanssonia centrifuga TaxID=98765 RepID=A0A4S4KKL1_9APHY|nr:hypothetical protein EW026_g3293 [Hermanssonia centrifuga]